ncbi:hypothetical protein DXG01_005392 [Tephrocybe rancida]|nr:hypothetical protein DXG01_005392 [Tephrocybe rancida]
MDIPDSAVTSSGSLKVWGSSDAISDITTAAGWEVIGCSPDKLSQDIRLVCNSDDSKAAGCSHLYEGAGAEGKIVRLPETCGKNAFARVARSWVPDDQSIPSSVAGKIVRRDGTQPQVKALALDTNFQAVDSSKAGPVNFAVRGANTKGAAADIDTSTVTPGRRSRIYGDANIERGLFSFVGDAIDSIKKLDTFDVNKSKTLDPFTVDKPFNLLNKQLSCPPITASLKIDVNAKANAVATIGLAASGTIVPPKVKDFSVLTSITGDIDGSVTMTATASGTLDSGKLKIFEVGIPGLDFPGVLTLGPTFEVNAQATAGLDIQADMTVGLNYHFDNAQLTFPSNSNKAQSAGTLKLSVSPSVQATGKVTAHLIPSLNLKVSALGDIVNAGIFLNLDASAEMSLSLEGAAQASVTVDKARREMPAVIGRYMPRAALVAAEAPPRALTTTSKASKTAKAKKTKSKAANAVKSTGKAVKATSTNAGASVVTAAGASPAVAAVVPAKTNTLAVTQDASASFGGCFRVNAGLDVNAGADASFFGLFDKNTQVSLFSKKFEILKKCFGNQKRSLAVISSLTTSSLKKRALSCSAAASDLAVSVADQVVQAGTN